MRNTVYCRSLFAVISLWHFLLLKSVKKKSKEQLHETYRYGIITFFIWVNRGSELTDLPGVLQSLTNFDQLPDLYSSPCLSFIIPYLKGVFTCLAIMLITQESRITRPLHHLPYFITPRPEFIYYLLMDSSLAPLEHHRFLPLLY